LSLLFLTPYFNYIPDAALAAVIIAAVADLVDFSLLAELWRVNSTYTVLIKLKKAQQM
jgi:MFS superfamily sulfate permease-like transporter